MRSFVSQEEPASAEAAKVDAEYVVSVPSISSCLFQDQAYAAEPKLWAACRIKPGFGMLYLPFIP